ncbi:MAG: hypothetical protein V4717_24430 [Bacteroidota bacterium]
MIKFKYFCATKNISRSPLYLLVIVLPIAHYIVVYNLPKQLHSGLEYVFIALWLIVFCLLTFDIFYKGFDEYDIDFEIEKIEEQRRLNITNRSKLPRFKENYLETLKKARRLITPLRKFVFILNPKEMLVNSNKNVDGIFSILMLAFLLCQHTFNYASAFGVITYVLIAGFYFLLFVKLLASGLLEGEFKGLYLSPNKKFGFILSSFLLCYWSKNTYVRTYGNEIIGSFFEKKQYETQYYVYISSTNDDKKIYKLPADLSINIDIRPRAGDKFLLELIPFMTKEIILKNVYWPNGGHLTFDGEDRQLEMYKKKILYDYNGNDWEVELRPEKVK